MKYTDRILYITLSALITTIANIVFMHVFVIRGEQEKAFNQGQESAYVINRSMEDMGLRDWCEKVTYNLDSTPKD